MQIEDLAPFISIILNLLFYYGLIKQCFKKFAVQTERR